MATTANIPSEHNRITIDQICNEGCINLLEAFLGELSMEYCSAYTKYINNPNDPDNIVRYNKVREFIESNYFEKLTGLNFEDLVPTLEGRCSKEWRNGTYGKIF